MLFDTVLIKEEPIEIDETVENNIPIETVDVKHEEKIKIEVYFESDTIVKEEPAELKETEIETFGDEKATVPNNRRNTPAERQRRYKEKLRLDPEKYEDYKSKKRANYHAKKRLVSDLSAKEKHNARLTWKIRKQNLRSSKKNVESFQNSNSFMKLPSFYKPLDDDQTQPDNISGINSQLSVEKIVESFPESSKTFMKLPNFYKPLDNKQTTPDSDNISDIETPKLCSVEPKKNEGNKIRRGQSKLIGNKTQLRQEI